MADFKKDFPVLSKYTYLNTAYSGLMHESLIGWRHSRDIEYLQKGSLYRDGHHEFTELIRKEVGSFFNCNTDCIALVPNFSFGFNTLVSRLTTNKKVLLLNNDYPSVNEPFIGSSFDVVYAEIDENLEKNIKDAVIRHKPDVLALSIVQYINGLKIDLSFLRQLKKDNPDLLIIADGTQYCGIETFDFNNSGIDILGASGYKWLLAGYGNGFMLFKKEVVPVIFKNSCINISESGFSECQELLTKHFEPGHLDTLSFGSLLFSLKFLNSQGRDKIGSKVKSLSAKAKSELSERGLLEKSIMRRKIHSSIFNIRGNSKLFELLKSKNIICSQRGGGIRISFHFYNTENDLYRLLEHLDK